MTDLIREARLRGFWLHRWGRDDAPELLALAKAWPGRQEVDVILIGGVDSSTGYRSPYFDGRFRPEIVC